MRNQKESGLLPGPVRAFGWSLLLACAIFVPLMIYNDGYFIFLGDFNVQQIPFYRHAHDMIRSGNFFWDWQTDLGANFIGSYSFYLLFSPFFWLTLPFPSDFVPHLMGPLLILKTACASLTSYLYIRRFVREDKWAVFGSILYAFSGFMTFNIFFNHFHEPCVFFPLLLLSLEELVENNRRGFFAFMVAVNCLVNYWFFVGEVFFVILYVAVRISCGDWNCSFGKFCLIAFESLLGVLIAAVGLIPSVLALMGNPRTGLETLLTGWNMWIYGWSQRFPAILQSFFFPPELPSRPNFFPDMGAKWASLSAWIPLFSSVGAIAYCRVKKRTFVKRLIIISMVMSLIPILNSVFVLFSESYYARWFYMPVLMLCIATAVALSERDTPKMRFALASSWRYVAFIIVFFIAAIGFSPSVKDGEITIGLYGNKLGFWLLSAAALLCLLLTALLLFGVQSRSFYRVSSVLLSAVVVIFTTGYIFSGKASKASDDAFLTGTVNGRYEIADALPDDGVFARSDLYHCGDNLGMFWDLPNIQAFHSVVPASIMEFYPEIGVKRDVSSKPSEDYPSLRAFLSVRWLFIPENDEEQSPMPGFRYYDSRLGYHIYENENFLPMGFVYRNGFDVEGESWDRLYQDDKVRAMLSSLALSREALDRNRDILTEEFTDPYNLPLLTDSAYQERLQEIRREGCDSFEIDNRGFYATCQLDEPAIVFFSVPYDKGWHAWVNGAPVQIEKANIGFMAVRAPAGECRIYFEYQTPGLFEGAVISGGGLLLLLLYLLVCRLFGVRAVHTLPQGDTASSDPNACLSGEDLCEEMSSDVDLQEEPEPDQDTLPVISFPPVEADRPKPASSPPPARPQPPPATPAKDDRVDAIWSYLESLEELPQHDDPQENQR